MTTLLKKINELEQRFEAVESRVKAFMPEPGRFERLKAEAEKLELAFPNPDYRPPHFGALVGVKDIFHTAGFDTRAGSDLPPEDLAGKEAESVRMLKSNGALIVGKTVTTEFAYFAPGPTRNPHNLAHTPGGSSSGSAAAVSAGLCELALGTQTIGSVNRPAGFCGTVGFKPTFGRISRSGVIPLSDSFDHVGLFSKTIAGTRRAAALLIEGWQAAGEAMLFRLGIPSGPYLDHASAEARSHLEEVVRTLEAAGYPLVEVPVLDDFQAVVDRHQLVVAAEAARAHAGWFEKHGEKYHRKTRALLQRGQQISDESLAEALIQIRQFRLHTAAAMNRARIDAFVTPSAPGPAPEGLESTGDPVMNLPWTQAGLPTITLPTGLSTGGLPLGTQLVGKRNLDEKLFDLAARLEPVIGRELIPQHHT